MFCEQAFAPITDPPTSLDRVRFHHYDHKIATLLCHNASTTVAPTSLSIPITRGSKELSWLRGPLDVPRTQRVLVVGSFDPRNATTPPVALPAVSASETRSTPARLSVSDYFAEHRRRYGPSPMKNAGDGAQAPRGALLARDRLFEDSEEEGEFNWTMMSPRTKPQAPRANPQVEHRLRLFETRLLGCCPLPIRSPNVLLASWHSASSKSLAIHLPDDAVVSPRGAVDLSDQKRPRRQGNSCRRGSSNPHEFSEWG
ncbi:unnamed protein product [Phytophthora fragariaefolia]|uniref:Unnamed protein product n=1 Tax=Phytophthora fragariaefolia TaxID=1490495 RepID=A0A9W6XX05_9STRA|nr:unnamed protein product [Phytophthora fragariaefolia]